MGNTPPPSATASSAPPALAPEVRRAVDLYVGGEGGGEPRLEAAEQLEEALLLEREEGEAAAAGENALTAAGVLSSKHEEARAFVALAKRGSAIERSGGSA